MTGFVFYTNKESRKSGELAANANVFLLFYWKSLGRQIRIEARSRPDRRRGGRLLRLAPAISRLGAWARSSPARCRSAQSWSSGWRTPSNATRRRYPPLPTGRATALPVSFEFWQDMPYVLHDRTVYRHAANGAWEQSKLFP